MNREWPARSVRSTAPRQSGFSYLEALVGLGIIVVAMFIALTFFVDLGSTMRTESTALATQQTGRLVLDELARSTRQAGFGVARYDPFNPAEWQASIVHASSHTLAFNADIDRTIGSLPTGQSITFPVGAAYAGEGPASSQSGAETYVYTLDANGDGALTTADRSLAEAGNFNPAADTDTPHDFAIFRRIYGYNGTDNGGALEPLAAFLFTNATTDAVYPDGGTPEPLFTYWLTEDLNGDGRLQDVECVNDVVDTCPPSTSRNPRLYLWGDTDFDGELSETEKTALLAWEVGATGWSKNPLVEGGSYVSTTLSELIGPGGDDAYTVKVTDADKIPSGSHVVIGSGGSAERHYVDLTATTAPELLVLGSAVANTHAAGVTVQVLPSTLMRAIRSVGITYSALTGTRDIDGTTRAVGRAGRKGSRGLDYRVMPFHREVEVINAPSVSLIKMTPVGAADVCPLKVVNACSDSDVEPTTRFTNLSGQNEFSFKVTDELGTPVAGVKVTLQNDDSSLGGLSESELTTDASGLVTVTYNMTGALGSDEIRATASCVSDAGLVETDTARARVTLHRLETELAQDCLTTASGNEPRPMAPFTVRVTSGEGPVSGRDVALSLDFDPAYLPSPPNFASLVGGLDVDGIPAGATDSSGVLPPLTFSTDSSGEVNGGAGILTDSSGDGARLRLTTAIPAAGCAAIPDSRTDAIAYFDLSMDSVSPSPGCTEFSPCTISAGMSAPLVRATLKINGNPVPGAPLDFVATDIESPTNGIETGASVVKPPSGVATDVNGEGEARVTNNGASVITPVTPLVTQVDVTSPGSPGLCSAGSIVSSSPRARFRFEAPAPQCESELDQAWLSKIDNKKLCVHSQNANEDGGCQQFVKGIQVTVYEADGVTPDPTVRVRKIEGGAVTASAFCSTTGQVRLFEDKCHAENRYLDNGELWLFTVFETCTIPMTPVAPQEFFTFSKIEFENDYPPGRDMDITLLYLCDGECDPFLESETFRVTLPF